MASHAEDRAALRRTEHIARDQRTPGTDDDGYSHAASLQRVADNRHVAQIRTPTAVMQEAYIQGVSTRAVDDLVQATGMTGITKSEVSRLCAEIDDKVKTFLNRPIEGDRPYLWIDATYVKVRLNGRIVPVAVIVVVGVNGDDWHEILGMDSAPSEAESFWTGFLRKLARRDLRGVKLAISDAHEGIKAAVTKVLNATWQPCRAGPLNYPSWALSTGLM